MVPIRRASLLAAIAIIIVLGPDKPANAQVPENRLLIASQMDFGSNRGYYLDFENSQPGTAPCPLGTLKLILGAADGTRWRFIATTPNWQVGLPYHVIATLTPSQSALTLNGALVGTSSGSYKLYSAPIQFNHVPSWANAPATYMVKLTRVTVTSSLNGHTNHIAATLVDKNMLPGLLVFNPQVGSDQHWQPIPGGKIIIDATFTIAPSVDFKAISPLIDKFGQNVYATWPGKVKTTAQLIASQKYEQSELARMPLVPHRDKFGGTTDLGWHETPTGYFRTLEHDGRWWLMTPLGNPCYYVGVCSAPQLWFDSTPVAGRRWMFQNLPTESSKFAPAWSGARVGDSGSAYNFNIANMIRKYGSSWQEKANKQAVRRLLHWGFCGEGKWSTEVPGVPFFPVLSYSGVPILVRHPDVWNPAVRTALVANLRAQITPLLRDPDVVGWSIGNEFDEIFTTQEITQILAEPSSTPARSALVSWALTHIYHGDLKEMANAWGAAQGSAEIPSTPLPSASDVERMRRYCASYYYKVLYNTVKSIDPNHLYFGFWLSVGWWQNSSDWSLIAPWCDVIGYDFYNHHFANAQFADLIKKSNKPILCGEFSFPPTWPNRGYGRYPYNSLNQNDAGRLYTRYIQEACASPYSVGDLWFEYRDEPITGRGGTPDTTITIGEHFAFGVVDVTDRPKWGLVTRMRAANGKTARWHSKARQLTSTR